MTNYEIIILLMISLGVTCYVAYYYKKQYKIFYSNFHMALRALSDTDPDLKLYLAKKELVNEEV